MKTSEIVLPKKKNEAKKVESIFILKQAVKIVCTVKFEKKFLQKTIFQAYVDKNTYKVGVKCN